MIKKTKTVYYCEFCGKHYLHKSWAKQHEKRCSKNPINFRPCLDCRHLEYIDITYPMTGDNGYCEVEFSVKSHCFKCNHQDKKEQLMFTLKAEHRGIHNKYDMEDQVPMPKECEKQVLLYDSIEYMEF